MRLRLSEHPLSKIWLNQFHTCEDKARASQLLNQIKLVSTRDFETGIEHALIALQEKLNATIAVYPIGPPIPKEVIGYDPLVGSIQKKEDDKTFDAGRRRKYGSEDRVGHSLAKLQAQFKRGGVSCIECVPTIKQLKTQGIKHIVLVDDVCGSGKRIADYWQAISRHIKSLLSFKRYELWIVLYAITSNGKASLTKSMPNFPVSDHLITVLPEANLKRLLSSDLLSLCAQYAKSTGMRSIGLGYKGSACPVVFEHGCPNNLPAILWANHRDWKALFPNGAIPQGLRSYFNGDCSEREVEILWKVNQPKLALGLMEALDYATPLRAEQRQLLTLLGLCLRRIPEVDLPRRLLLTNIEISRLIKLAARMGLYDTTKAQVTPLGREVVSRFRERYQCARKRKTVGKNPSGYYPLECEGRLRNLGKTNHDKKRLVPMEPL